MFSFNRIESYEKKVEMGDRILFYGFRLAGLFSNSTGLYLAIQLAIIIILYTLL